MNNDSINVAVDMFKVKNSRQELDQKIMLEKMYKNKIKKNYKPKVSIPEKGGIEVTDF